MSNVKKHSTIDVVESNAYDDEYRRHELEWNNGSLDREDVMNQLRRFGFVVINNVISKDRNEELYTAFWKYMEELSPLREADRATWIESNRPVHRRGYITHYNCGFQRCTIDARTAVKPVFEKIYDTSHLWTNTQGVDLSWFPMRTTYDDLEDWFDRSYDRDNFKIEQLENVEMRSDMKDYEKMGYIQGALSLTNQVERSDVFVCVPYSHRFYNILTGFNTKRTHSRRAKTNRKTNRSPEVTDDMIDFLVSRCKLSEEEEMKPLRVPLKAGSMLLWDSRLVCEHTSYCKDAELNEGRNYRLQIRVSMYPVQPKIAKAEMRKRVQAYENGVCSKFDSRVFHAFPSSMNTHNRDQSVFHPVKKCELTDEEKLLHGIELYEDLKSQVPETGKKRSRSKPVKESEKISSYANVSKKKKTSGVPKKAKTQPKSSSDHDGDEEELGTLDVIPKKKKTKIFSSHPLAINIDSDAENYYYGESCSSDEESEVGESGKSNESDEDDDYNEDEAMVEAMFRKKKN